jgi:hypothetical protein
MAVFAIVLVVGFAVMMMAGGTLVASGKLSAADIAGYAGNAGFNGPDLQVAVAVALAESSGNPAAVGDQTLAPTNGPAVGLWQINTGKHKEYTADQLIDPQVNANMAYQLYSARGGQFTDWTTYNNGKYGDYIVQAQQGVNA